jgi:hypothetical protein
MNYLKEFRAELRERIEGGDIDAAVKFAAERVLESYRNGQDAGPRKAAKRTRG